MFLAGIDWDPFHDWLERWWGLAECAVAAGTFALAISTYVLSRGSRAETRAIVAQSESLGKQVDLQREEMGRRRKDLPQMFPDLVGRWGSGQMVFRNVGSGIALNVSGWSYWRMSDDHPWHLVGRLFGGGDVNEVGTVELALPVGE